MSAWNPDVKPGDKLATREGSHWRYWWDMHTVERVTATQVVCERARFSKADGRKVGDRWKQAQPLTEALAQEIAQERRDEAAKTWAADADRAIKALTTEQIEQVKALVEQLAASNGKAEAA